MLMTCSPLESRFHHGLGDRATDGATAARLAVGVAAALDDDGHGDLRVLRRREAGEPGVGALVGVVLGGAGLARDPHAVDLGGLAAAVLDDRSTPSCSS